MPKIRVRAISEDGVIGGMLVLLLFNHKRKVLIGQRKW
jgi:hypothetical protein